jgi:hypothetical protein
MNTPALVLLVWLSVKLKETVALGDNAACATLSGESTTGAELCPETHDAAAAPSMERKRRLRPAERAFMINLPGGQTSGFFRDRTLPIAYRRSGAPHA